LTTVSDAVLCDDEDGDYIDADDLDRATIVKRPTTAPSHDDNRAAGFKFQSPGNFTQHSG